MSLAAESVTTTGVNWELLLSIVTCVILVVGTFTAWVGRQITHAVNDLSDKLQAKLETKDAVSSINLRLTTVETTLRDMKGNP